MHRGLCQRAFVCIIKIFILVQVYRIAKLTKSSSNAPVKEFWMISEASPTDAINASPKPINIGLYPWCNFPFWYFQALGNIGLSHLNFFVNASSIWGHLPSIVTIHQNCLLELKNLQLSYFFSEARSCSWNQSCWWSKVSSVFVIYVLFVVQWLFTVKWPVEAAQGVISV